MSLTESADGAVSRMPVSATKVGLVGAKLAAWCVATVAVTFMMLRPSRRPGNRGSLFLGSGVIVVLCKTLLMVSDGSDTAPAVAATVTASAPVAPAVEPTLPTTRTAPVPKPVFPKTAAPKSAAPKAARPKAQVADGNAAKAHAATAEGSLTRLATPQGAKVTPVAAPAAKPAPAAAKPGSVLGPRYLDKVAGYSVQFPAGWTYKTFNDGQCWILDATDGQSAVMSVGFSQFPAQVTVEEIVPAKVTKGLQSRPGTVVQGTGYTTIGGKRCLWHKYTGPIPRTDGNPRMTAVHYLLPLHDGRALEVRVAAAPEKFNEVAPRMKQAIDSFKLLAATPDPRTAKAARGTKEVPKG